MPSLLGLGGFKESGKDEFADELVRHGWVKLGMSDDLHDWLMVQNPIVQAVAQFDGQGHYKGILIERYADVVNRVGYTTAKALVKEVRDQQKKVGGDCGRDLIDENIWIDRVKAKITTLHEEGLNVVVTGIRYGNEIDGIEELGGVSMWCDRPGVEGTKDTHASENSLGPDDFMMIMWNYGTLEEWREQAADWMKTYA